MDYIDAGAETSPMKTLLWTLLVGIAVTGLAACSSMTAPSSTSASTGPVRTTGLPPIHHVFVIMLENESAVTTFGDPAADPYLASVLPAKGAYLENYYAIGHVSNDNYIAFVSGQPPNIDTQNDCLTYAEFPSGYGQEAWQGATGIQEGVGCVYPASVQTLANQLTAKGLTWKAYMEDMGNDPERDGAPTSVCGHPALNGPDGAILAVQGDGYATRHDPFVYFDSIIDSPSVCSHVVPLGTPTGAMPASDTVGATGLATDLKSIATTPNFAWISPNLCDDGHDYPCRNETSPGGSDLADIDTFLETWVPKITSSPAFKKDGLLEITFDEAEVEGTGSNPDYASCCNEARGPTGSAPGVDGPGGGRIGTILISPFIKAGSVVTTPFNHYSSLASIEKLFDLPLLGDAQTVPTTFANGVFTTTK
ncbi:MAG: alkaline phosphatase family protein [Acidimicrobiales bacterium]